MRQFSPGGIDRLASGMVETPREGGLVSIAGRQKRFLARIARTVLTAVPVVPVALLADVHHRMATGTHKPAALRQRHRDRRRAGQESRSRQMLHMGASRHRQCDPGGPGAEDPGLHLYDANTLYRETPRSKIPRPVCSRSPAAAWIKLRGRPRIARNWR
jgi:hypothetical protein